MNLHSIPANCEGPTRGVHPVACRTAMQSDATVSLLMALAGFLPTLQISCLLNAQLIARMNPPDDLKFALLICGIMACALTVPALLVSRWTESAKAMTAVSIALGVVLGAVVAVC
jgi:hypothetical protein